MSRTRSHTPRTVRLLPMSLRSEFPDDYTVEHVQQWFLDDLARRENGRYLCHRVLRAKNGAMVLFQCENQIIASATLTDSKRFEMPQEGYEGCMDFNVSSIKVFDPVGPDACRAVWPTFKRFSQAMQALELRRYPIFERRLESVRLPAARGRQVVRNSGRRS